MATAQNPELITYVDSSQADWREFRPGSRRKVLYEDAATGHDEHLYIPQVRSWIRIVHPGPARTF